MIRRRSIWLTFAGILLLTALAGIVDWPKGPDIRIGSFFKEVKVHLGLDLSGGAQLTYQADLSKIEATDRASALEGTRDVIERRVNAFGVSEPIVQTSTVAGSSRIIVELPGVTDAEEANRQIGETPLLEFREQKEPEPLTAEQQAQIDASDATAKEEAEAALRRLDRGEDFAALADELSDDPGNADTDDQKKGGDLGFQEPSIYVTEFKTALEGLKDGERTPGLVKTEFGYHIIKREESKTENVNGSDTVQIRARHILFQTLNATSFQAQDPYAATGLSGQHLKRAEVTFDPTTGSAQVTLTFNDEGKRLFADITKRNVGKQVAIYLDGQPISIPTVQEEIATGEAVISGNFTLPESRQLVARLNAGALPVPVTLLSKTTIGASLGRVSVERSFVAGLLGITLVSLFMVFFYRVPGLLAVLALGVYSLLALALFKLWPVTLTLAGVAGFILSIGMAVDANVLIFERMREELRQGKHFGVAIEEGFARAWPSIRDSNVSSLITCFILAWFGTSLVKGFAITLALGILMSMFSAITVTRTLTRLFLPERLRRHAWMLGVALEPHNDAPGR